MELTMDPDQGCTLDRGVGGVVDPRVSSQHLQLQWVGGLVYATQLSNNPSRIRRGQQVPVVLREAQQFALEDGDVLELVCDELYLPRRASVPFKGNACAYQFKQSPAESVFFSACPPVPCPCTPPRDAQPFAVSCTPPRSLASDPASWICKPDSRALSSPPPAPPSPGSCTPPNSLGGASALCTPIQSTDSTATAPTLSQSHGGCTPRNPLLPPNLCEAPHSPAQDAVRSILPASAGSCISPCKPPLESASGSDDVPHTSRKRAAELMTQEEGRQAKFQAMEQQLQELRQQLTLAEAARAAETRARQVAEDRELQHRAARADAEAEAAAAKAATEEERGKLKAELETRRVVERERQRLQELAEREARAKQELDGLCADLLFRVQEEQRGLLTQHVDDLGALAGAKVFALCPSSDCPDALAGAA